MAQGLTARNNSGGSGRCNRYTIGAGVLFGLFLFVALAVFVGGVDWFLSIVFGVGILLLLFVNSYLVIKWSDPNDHASNIWLTVLIILSLTVAEGAILGLPLDVANNSNDPDCMTDDVTCYGGMNMHSFWNILGCMIFALIVFFIPLAIFHYESYDDPVVRKRRGKGNDNRRACMIAFGYETCLLACALLTLILMWKFLGTSQIPVTEYTATVSTLSQNTYSVSTTTSSSPNVAAYFAAQLTSAEQTSANEAYKDTDTLNIDASFFVYVIALTAFVGWFLFVVFGGIGLAALPITLINNFIDRPKILTRDQIATEKLRIQNKVSELIQIGSDMKQERSDWGTVKHSWNEGRKKKNEDRSNLNKFKQMVFLLENELDALLVCSNLKENYNPLTPHLNLVGGIFCLVLSLLWLLHMILYMLVEPAESEFLNGMLIPLSNSFNLLSIALVGLFAGYLLVAVVVGLFKFGVRFFCITLHPMRYGKTLINAFLFNTSVIVICALPVVQFTTEAFDSYARHTAIGATLVVQVKYLKFLSLFFETKAFLYLLLVLSCLSGVYLTYYHRDTSVDAKTLKEQITGRR